MHIPKILRLQNITVKYPRKLEEYSRCMIFGVNEVKKAHKIENKLVFSFFEAKNNRLTVMIRDKGFLNYFANLLKKNKIKATISSKDLEHGLNWPFSEAFERLYLRHQVGAKDKSIKKTTRVHRLPQRVN